MPTLPYPSSTRPEAAEHSWLRVLGGVLAFLSILLALLGIIFHQRVPDLMLASIVGIFALRVFLLWLGAQPRQQQPIAGCSARQWVRYPLQAPPAPPGQPAPSASPSSPTQPLPQLAPEQHRQQSMPMPPASVVPLSPMWPRSIGPQRPPQAPTFPAQPAPPPHGVPPMSPAPPPALWPPYASGPLPSPAPLPWPPRQENWQDDGGKHVTQQRGNNHGTT
jgi:hypothetical protein